MGPWMIVTYAILIGGGFLIAWELKLLGLELGFLIAFAVFVAIALAPVPDHCMVASWHVTPMCGRDLWQVLVTSPEVLIFALFMLPDPRTVPDGRLARVVFGVLVALLAVLLLGATSLEFWTKTAILGSLVIACALRFALSRFLAPFDEPGGGVRYGFHRLGRRLPAALAVAVILVGLLPDAADLSTHGPQPAAALADGLTPTIGLTVGAGPDLASWVSTTAGSALPSSANSGPVSASARVWTLPPIPDVFIAPNVIGFNPSLSPQIAAAMAHDTVLDLIIESEARRSHDLKLAQSGAGGDALQEFVDVINQDIAGGKVVAKSYSIDQVSLNLFLPKFSSQASRLVGVSVHGKTTLTTRDSTGKVLSTVTTAYAKVWGLAGDRAGGSYQLIVVDYTGLNPAP
jgi:hypothetical protein